MKYEIYLDDNGDVLNIKSLNSDELSDSNLRRLDSMAIDSLMNSVFLPKSINGKKVSTTFIKEIPFGANACT